MTTLPDQTTPDQTPTVEHWRIADDLLTDIRVALRTWERQPAAGHDIANGLTVVLPALHAGARSDDTRRLCGDLTQAARRAAATCSPEIRQRQILTARSLLAQIDLIVTVDRLAAHDAEHEAAAAAVKGRTA